MRKFILLGLDGACPDIIARAIEDGHLPNFRILRDAGCWADNVPFPSAVTPGNWASIATGAKPATIGISDFWMHTPGKPLDEKHDVFTKDTCRAQTLWDAYSRRGYRVATISFPMALPQTEAGHLAIGNSGQPAENAHPYTIAGVRSIIGGSYQPADPYKWGEFERVDLIATSEKIPLNGFTARYKLPLKICATNPGFSGEHYLEIYFGTKNDQPSAVVFDNGKYHVFGIREWSPFIERDFSRANSEFQRWWLNKPSGNAVTGEFRFRLVHLDLEPPGLMLHCSPIYPEHWFSSDPQLVAPLRERFGPYSDNLPTSRLLTGTIDADGILDDFRLQAQWQANAAVALINDMGFHGVFAKWHGFDKFYHFFMHKIDPIAPDHDPSEFDYWEQIHIRLMQIADEMVGKVIGNLHEDTDLIVVSDHGLMASRRSVWVNRLLAKHGYISYHRDSEGKVVIDWSRTRAFVSGFLMLNVNLKGRDPEGIVEPGRDYEQLKEELIELLRGWVDPETGLHVMTDVFDPSKDGAFYGLGSELDGDIRYFTRPGYGLHRSLDVDGDELVTGVVSYWHGDHGATRPTTRYGRGSDVGIFYAYGKAFRSGYRRLRPVFPCDIVPTILHISNQPPLANQEGAVLHDILA
ncbi:MAG: alkaline phosphatase family protein [Armatimonadota bacterium]